MRRECVFFLIALTVQFSSAQLDLSFIDPFYYLYNLQNNNNFNNIHNFNLNNNNNNNNNDFLDFNQQPLTGCIANSNNLQGTCMQGHECKYSRGTNTGRGNCTFLNSCCTYTKSCNDTVRARVVYFQNPANPRSGPSPCTLRLQLLNEDICQIRVDVMQIDLEGMIVENGGTGGPLVCSEYVTVDPMPTETIPRICGDRMNNHFYIHLNRNLYNNYININVILQQLSTNLASSGTWNMRLTQLECPGRKNKKTAVNHKKRNENQAADDLGELAPAGCTQYNTQLTGVVQSFGNTVATGTPIPLDPSRIADNYAVCFKRFPNTCGVMFTISAPTMAVCNDMLLELNIPLVMELVTPCTDTGMASFTMYHPGPLYINYVIAAAEYNNVLLNYAITSTCPTT